MAAPALRIPVSVDMAGFEQSMDKMASTTSVVMKKIAWEIVKAGDVTERGIKLMGNYREEIAKVASSPAFRKIATELLKMNAVIAVEGVRAWALFGAELVRIAAKMGAVQAIARGLGRIAFIGGGIGLVVAAFEGMAAISDMAAKKIEEFHEIQKKAFESGVSAEFFQRFTQGGKAMGLTLDEATEAMKRFADASKSALEGSELENRIKQLKEYGNLQGNTGVAKVDSALGTEDKMRATVDMLKQMLEKGERLAALDIAEKAFGPKIAENIRNNSGYLDHMLMTADKLAASKIISQDNINQAAHLKSQLDEAKKILEEKFKPIQEDLVKLGMAYQESWIQFYQNLSISVTAAQELYGWLKGIPGALADAGRSPIWKRISDATERWGLNTALPKEMELDKPGEGKVPLTPGQQMLARAMRNPQLVAQETARSEALYWDIKGDASKKKPKLVADPGLDPFERQVESITKHTNAMIADTATVFQNNAATAQLRAEFALLNAAKLVNKDISDEQIQTYQRLRAEGIAPLVALQEANIKLSEKQAQGFIKASEGAKIATSNYDAAAEKLKNLNAISQQLGSALSTAFADAILEGKKLNVVLSEMLKTLAKAILNWAVMSAFTPQGGEKLSPFASLLSGFMGKAGGGPVSAGTPYLVGERGPELMVPNTSGMIVPNDALGGYGGGGSVYSYAPAIDARGASVEAVARLAQILEQDRMAFASKTIAVIQQARRGRVPGL